MTGAHRADRANVITSIVGKFRPECGFCRKLILGRVLTYDHDAMHKRCAQKNLGWPEPRRWFPWDRRDAA